MAGGSSRAPPPASSHPSGTSRGEDVLLGTEESLGPEDSMDITRPGGSSQAGVAKSAAPVSSAAPSPTPGLVSPGGGEAASPDEEEEILPLPPRRAVPRLLLPPGPRNRTLLRVWKGPLTVEEMPPGLLKDAYLAIPVLRRLDAWHRRTRRFPQQVTLPEGVECDLPALLSRDDEAEALSIAEALAKATGELEFNDLTPVVDSRWVFRPRPFLSGEDPHVYHGQVREEYRLRTTSGYLVHWSRAEFASVPEVKKGPHYPVLPGWWESMEVPCGFPARIPLIVAYFASYLRGSGGHRAFAILASNWVVEVARGWYADVCRRGYLWHLPPSLVEGIETLGFPWLCYAEDDREAEEVLRAIVRLHNQLDWGALAPFLTIFAGPGVG
ncbi:hypothetical protein MMPV_001338 [Pyropia vietnamensis]